MPDELEKALEPKRIIRIFSGIFLIIMLLLATVFGTKMAYSTLNRAEQATHDHAWFVATHDQILALEIQINETRESLLAHQKQASFRWISRQDDRLQIQRLTDLLLAKTEEHTQLIKSYNSSAEGASKEILGGLPAHIALKEVKETPAKEASE